jgi:DNA-binding CsgD family transcriptional regulator
VGTAGREDCTELIGRGRVLDTLDDVLASSLGQVLVVAGGWGCGRTALLEEASRRGERLRFEVIDLVGMASLASEPYGVLRPWADGSSVDELRRSMLARAADQHRQLLVVADDAHLLDEPSTAVLGLLAARNEATVVASVPSGRRLAWLEHLSSARRTVVDPLDPADALALIERWLPGALDGRAARSLVIDAGGRPVLLRAAVDGARTRGRLVPLGPDQWRLVGTGWVEEPLVAAIGERMASLTDVAREALELVCVAGVIGHAALRDLVDESVVDELERQELVTVQRDGRRLEVRACPPLLAQVVRRQLPTGVRVRRSTAVAGALVQRGSRRGGDAGVIARLHLDAGVSVVAGTAVAAARHARREGDVDEAERLARVAVDQGDGVEAVLELASILHERGDASASEDVLLAFESCGEHDRALVALARANNLEWSLQRPDEADQLLASTKAVVGDEQLQVELAAAKAGLLHLGGRSGDAARDLEALLERSCSPRARHRVLNNLASACAFTGDVARVRWVVEQALALQPDLVGEPALPDAGFLFLSLAFATCEAGLLDEAGEVAGMAYRAATEVDESGGMGWFALVLGRIALQGGRLDDADRWLAEARWRLGVLELDGPVLWARAGEVLTAASRGSSLPGAPLPTDAAALAPLAFGLHVPDVLRAQGWEAAARGSSAETRVALHAAAQAAASSGARPQEVQAWLDLVRLSSHPSEAEGAAVRLEVLAGQLGTPVSRAAATLARGAATDHPGELEHAAQAFEQIGMVLVAAEVWARAAAGHHRRRTRRAEAFAEAQVARLVQGDWATPGLARHGTLAALTPRELQVARLAASGMRTDTIADELSIGFRTVENHLHRAYGKLGVAGKHELAGVLSGL